ncbi:MAG TPA: DUF4405 domain-containing protein [Xanthobacteraceae bacterium]|jgi:cytochrome b561|nr:DUF4405 domain-containing protein [Xanthobacteraceae bacterium]
MHRNQFLLFLDATLFVAALILWPVPLAGLAVHEWLGLAAMALLLIHVVLQWRWIATAVRRLGDRGAGRTRGNVLLNCCLFATTMLVMFSGIMISEVALYAVGLDASSNFAWHPIHGWSQTVMTYLVGLHIALNWRWIRAVVLQSYLSVLSAGRNDADVRTFSHRPKGSA